MYVCCGPRHEFRPRHRGVSTVCIGGYELKEAGVIIVTANAKPVISYFMTQCEGMKMRLLFRDRFFYRLVFLLESDH